MLEVIQQQEDDDWAPGPPLVLPKQQPTEPTTRSNTPRQKWQSTSTPPSSDNQNQPEWSSPTGAQLYAQFTIGFSKGVDGLSKGVQSIHDVVQQSIAAAQTESRDPQKELLASEDNDGSKMARSTWNKDSRSKKKSATFKPPVDDTSQEDCSKDSSQQDKRDQPFTLDRGRSKSRQRSSRGDHHRSKSRKKYNHRSKSRQRAISDDDAPRDSIPMENRSRSIKRQRSSKTPNKNKHSKATAVEEEEHLDLTQDRSINNRSRSVARARSRSVARASSKPRARSKSTKSTKSAQNSLKKAEKQKNSKHGRSCEKKQIFPLPQFNNMRPARLLKLSSKNSFVSDTIHAPQSNGKPLTRSRSQGLKSKSNARQEHNDESAMKNKESIMQAMYDDDASPSVEEEGIEMVPFASPNGRGGLLLVNAGDCVTSGPTNINASNVKHLAASKKKETYAKHKKSHKITTTEASKDNVKGSRGRWNLFSKKTKESKPTHAKETAKTSANQRKSSSPSEPKPSSVEKKSKTESKTSSVEKNEKRVKIESRNKTSPESIDEVIDAIARFKMTAAKLGISERELLDCVSLPDGEGGNKASRQ